MSLLKLFSMFKMKSWYIPGEDEIKKITQKIAIRCRNCEKETMIELDHFNTTYQDISTSFELNIILNNIGMLWIIEKH